VKKKALQASIIGGGDTDSCSAGRKSGCGVWRVACVRAAANMLFTGAAAAARGWSGDNAKVNDNNVNKNNTGNHKTCRRSRCARRTLTLVNDDLTVFRLCLHPTAGKLGSSLV
jgi:hypothetical protein